MMSSFSRHVHEDDTTTNARAPTVLSREQPRQSSRMKALLYVWGQREKNSANALDVAKQSGAIDFITIIDVRNLRVAEIPDWMSGVPIVLITDDSGEDATVFKGTAALQKIQDVSQFPDEFEPVVFEKPVAPVATPVHQHVEGIGNVPTRQITMPRGIDEQGPPSQQQQQEPQHFDPSISEEKVSAQDMQVQIEEILKRREAMMQEAQQSGGGVGAPLPSMSASS